MILRRLFEGYDNAGGGFYVDVGAHHPKRFSNTYCFYKQGWRGINIDAMPGSMKLFVRVRSRDINIECPVARERKELIYHVFNDPALNGFSFEISKSRESAYCQYKIVDRIPMMTRPLAEILTDYLPKNQSIDFMNIDVEGLDYEVVQSNDWDLFRPRIVLVELPESTFEGLKDDPVARFLKEKGYAIYAKCVNTILFRDER